ncbi:5'-nucleotidase SurE1 [Methanobrevibacter ruminantium M1]|uniref:5'-nucleotidase SurE n=2 Tax=Methanobrevibacter ruminantium TaxID=83816 RepID=D3E0Y0_METRM|nr:5'-nucleotidase SurE1 [Methanobrevibacter ruminantium M1]
MIHMKILLSNDDGVNASGILAAKHAVEDLGDAIIVAPSNQQSGIGHALTLFEPLRVNKVILADNDIGYGVSGTPTDAVTIALFELLDECPDLAISGINTGMNTGKAELTTSGTLGAAIETATFNIPTIAVSQHVSDDDLKFDEGEIEIDFSSSVKVLRELVKKIIKDGFPKGIDILNLNVPSHPDSYEPVICPLGDRMYWPVVEKRHDPRGREYYWINGDEYVGNPKDSDIDILNQNIPTITPLTLDMTHNMDYLREWYG